jgi:hypothetical protein
MSTRVPPPVIPLQRVTILFPTIVTSSAVGGSEMPVPQWDGGVGDAARVSGWAGLACGLVGHLNGANEKQGAMGLAGLASRPPGQQSG